MEIRINGVNVFNPLEGKLDDIIECFVEFYGEKHREKITHNLKNTEYFFLPRNRLEPLQDEFDKYFEVETKKLYHEFYTNISPNSRKMPEGLIDIERLRELKQEVIDIYENKSLFTSHRFDSDINCLLQYIGELKTSEDFAKEEAARRNIPVESNDFQYLVWEFRNEEKSEEELKEYFSIFENREKFYQFIEKCETGFIELGYDEKLKKLEQEQEYINSQIFESEEKKKKAQKDAEKRLNDFFLAKIKEILDDKSGEFENWSKWDKESCIKTYQDILNTDFKQDIEWISDFRKKRFIEFFNNLAFDCGSNLEDYLNNTEIQQKIISDQTLIDFQNLQNQNKKDIENANEILSENLLRVKQMELEQGEEELSNGILDYMNGVSSGQAYVTIGLSKTEELRLFTVAKWACGSGTRMTSSLDWELLHELGHVATSSSFAIDDTLYWKTGVYVTGDYLETQLPENSNIGNRVCSLNEVINDYFTKSIFEIVKQKGVSINLGEQGTMASMYALAFKLMENFIENNKQELKEAVMCDNPMALAEIMGKDNYEILATACGEFLNLASNKSLFSQFFDEVVAIRDKHKISTYDTALMDVDWSEEVKPFIDCFKKVALVERNIKIAKMQNPEMEVEKYVTEMDFHL